MSSVPKITIYGASGQALAILQCFARGFLPDSLCDVAAFIDDAVEVESQSLANVPVISFDIWREHYRHLPGFVSVGAPSARRRLVAKLEEAGCTFADLYAGIVSRFPYVIIGVGTFVSEWAYIGPMVRIGNHVQVMPMCSLGHDIVVSDYTTICPGCTISGHVVIEEGVFVGAGTTIVNGRADAPLLVGRDSFIAAGSVVTKSVPARSKIAGNPGRPLREIARRRRAGIG
jgi:sugar O-acyltransferase (sialic acid O-acetyltransferase NeuD family)